jgi:hypothetical protein
VVSDLGHVDLEEVPFSTSFDSTNIFSRRGLVGGVDYISRCEFSTGIRAISMYFQASSSVGTEEDLAELFGD